MGTQQSKNILILGLDNSGKTTLLKKISAEDSTVSLPTLGYTEKQLKLKNINIKCIEVGGRQQLRSTWDQFYKNIDQLIWVVDAADHRRMQEVSLEIDIVLTKLIQVKNKVSVLVLANKCDLQLAMTEAEVAQRLALHTFTIDYSIQKCSALRGDGIEDAINWIVQKSAK
ncbi:ADP-ribosylation_factor like protein 2a [Hexamita inflata]|uniref:ADP-ribosylation factor like protein 2a n=1 Tax=Hexamita inflata TaxID=28002 RepID=A0AA86NVJ5_9EUKA|nr:ADP-ribosylation factor like protein 2a [Hexamita inflata]